MQYKMLGGELSYIENGEKVENDLFRRKRRMENSQSDKNQTNQRKLTSEEDAWELKFDLDELQELFTMSTHPYVIGLLLSLVDELQNRVKDMRCDLTDKLGTVKKWSDLVTGSSTCRKEESNRNLESNITSHTIEELWITVNREHKKPPSLNHKTHHQILVIKISMIYLVKKGNYELMAHESMGTHEPKVKNESRDMVQRAKNKHLEKKHKIIVIGDSQARGCTAEIKLNLDAGFKFQGFVTPGRGVNNITTSTKIDIQHLSKQDVVVVWGGSKDVGKK